MLNETFAMNQLHANEKHLKTKPTKQNPFKSERFFIYRVYELFLTVILPVTLIYVHGMYTCMSCRVAIVM